MTKQPTTREEWYSLIEEYKSSSLTQVNFCKQKSLILARFAYYLQQYRKKDQGKLSQSPAFNEVIVKEGNSSQGEIKIELPNGFRCQVSSNIYPEQLKKILGAILTC